jgi:hypothetical protein
LGIFFAREHPNPEVGFTVEKGIDLELGLVYVTISPVPLKAYL